MEELDNPTFVIQNLLNPSGVPLIFTLTISQFREVYTEIQKAKQATPVHIIITGDWAMAQVASVIIG